MSLATMRARAWVEAALRPVSGAVVGRVREVRPAPPSGIIGVAAPTTVDQHAAERWPVIAAHLLSALYIWVLVWLAVAVVTPLVVLRWQPVVITSGSMAPMIRAGDIVLNAATDGAVGPGQVITFQDPARAGALNTHRVVSVQSDGSYRTRGDANPAPDSTPVPPDAVVGRGRLLIPLIGLPLHWISAAPLLFAVWAAATITTALVVIGPHRR